MVRPEYMRAKPTLRIRAPTRSRRAKLRKVIGKRHCLMRVSEPSAPAKANSGARCGPESPQANGSGGSSRDAAKKSGTQPRRAAKAYQHSGAAIAAAAAPAHAAGEAVQAAAPAARPSIAGATLSLSAARGKLVSATARHPEGRPRKPDPLALETEPHRRVRCGDDNADQQRGGAI